MRLIIKRGYVEGKKSFLSSTALYFTLYCKTDFTKEQKELIEKYNIFDLLLTNEKIPGQEIPGLQVSPIVSGIELHFNNIVDFVIAERIVMKSCEQLRGIIAALSLIGTQNEIDFEKTE